MRNLIGSRFCCCIRRVGSRKVRFSSSVCPCIRGIPASGCQDPRFHRVLDRFKNSCFPPKPSFYLVPVAALRCLHANSTYHEARLEGGGLRFLCDFSRVSTCVSDSKIQCRNDLSGFSDDSSGEVEPIDSWEEEEDAEPKIGDGGDGGGIVIQNCPWGEKALSLARETLPEFDEDMKLYAFRTSSRGYVYVRLDKLSNPYGCPSMEEIETFSRLYKQKLDALGSAGEIPDDLALEVSSPGADRLLQVPYDLLRFKEMPMIVSYMDHSDSTFAKKKRVFFLVSIDAESGQCVWKLADVRENRDPAAKGRPLGRKQREHRLRIPYDMIKQVTLYLSY